MLQTKPEEGGYTWGQSTRQPHKYVYTVVWEKFTIETVHGKTVCGKIFSSLEENDNFLTMNFYGQIWDQTFCSID